jgi:Spy/CpxP family protein refolding chaperone
MERALGLYGTQGRWWNDPEMVQKLQLTDDQRRAMDQILLDHREKLIDMRAAVGKAELALEPMMGGDQPNESQIIAQIDKVAQARAELEKTNARFLLAIRRQLSPDQWKQLQAARAERMQRRWGQGGMRQNQPPAHVGPDGGPQGMLNEVPPPDHTGFAPGLGDH